MKKLLLLILLFEIGCMPNNKPGSEVMQLSEFRNLEAAGDCTPAREGENAFLVEEGDFYTCNANNWRPL